jgi:thymidylate kinase
MQKIVRIIVEGPDCSGKSTLVNQLKNSLQWDSKSLHHQQGDQFSRYLKEYALAEEVVLDRSHFSEEVYSKLWRGGSPFTKKEKIILNQLCKLNTLIILACPKLKILKKRYLSRDYEQQISLEELKKSREFFLRELSEQNPIIYFSESYEELNKLIDKIRSTIK